MSRLARLCTVTQLLFARAFYFGGDGTEPELCGVARNGLNCRCGIHKMIVRRRGLIICKRRKEKLRTWLAAAERVERAVWVSRRPYGTGHFWWAGSQGSVRLSGLHPGLLSNRPSGTKGGRRPGGAK